MTRAFTLLLFTVSVCCWGNPIPAGFLNRPLSFEPNRGQAAPSVRFVARGNSHDYLLRASGVTVSGASLRFFGANAEPQVFAQEPLGERHNYFHGAVSQTDIPTYRRVRYSRLYPGIDCVFYGDQKGLEFDFEVSPGVDPDKIRLRWNDAKRVRLDANGELVIETISGDLRQRKPTVYQQRNGRRVLIDGGYLLAADGEIRVTLGRYDRTLPVIIDPVLFALGQDVISVAAMATDQAGNLYLTGSTSASVLPTTVGAVQPAYPGGTCEAVTGFGGPTSFPCPDAFVIKLDSMGQIAYATYLGGSGVGGGFAIAVDSSGNAYVGGSTFTDSSTNSIKFPITKNAAFPKPTGNGDGFVTKFNPAGNQLVYSTFIPGAPVTGIALDAQGSVYLAGTANPQVSPFPVTPGAFQTSSSTPAGVVAKLNAAGSELIYGTYLGGSANPTLAVANTAVAIAIDASGAAYVTGFSASPDFPTTPGAFQTKLPEPTGSAYIAKIAPSGASLIYSTFLGGGQGREIRVDAGGDAIVLGATGSTDFPVTPGAFQSTGPSAAWTISFSPYFVDGAFLSKLNPTGSALVYSTYVTGASSLDIDTAGNAYVAGAATYGFPTTAGAYQACSHGGTSDIFAAEFDPDGTLTGASYLGGSGADNASAIIARGAGSIELAGTTNSPDFPGIVGASNLSFVDSVLINDPNRSSIPCLAYAVQNAATFIEGPVAPGEVVTLRGKGIGPQKGVSAKIGSDGKISTELAGVKVLFGALNNPAPLLYVQSEQINAVVPWEAGMDALNMSVQVEYNGSVIGTFVPEYPVAPGIFIADYSTQQAAVLNADGTPNSPKNPAKRGSVVSFYGTGGGPMNPPAITGGIWPISPLAQLALPVSVQIGNAEADVRYAGSAPGLVSGIFQINVLVPDTPGLNPIIVTIGGKSSPQSAYLFVQ